MSPSPSVSPVSHMVLFPKKPKEKAKESWTAPDLLQSFCVDAQLRNLVIAVLYAGEVML